MPSQPDGPRAAESGHGHDRRAGAEEQGELSAAPVDGLEEQLRGGQVGQERAQCEREGEAVAQRGAVGHHGAEGSGDAAHVERQPVARVERLGQPEQPQRERCRREHREAEHPAPRSAQQEQLAEPRPDDGRDQEDGHDQRQRPCHAVAHVGVASDREGHGTRRGGADPPQEAACQQELQRRRESGARSTQRVERQAPVQRRLAAEAIRQRPEDDLGAAQPQQVQRHRPGERRGVRRQSEGGPDLPEGGQHHIDAEG